MYKISDTKITMTRGDSLALQVQMFRNGEQYTPVDGDYVRFAVKTKLNSSGTEFVDTEPLILKEIPIETMILQLGPEDTWDLPFGDYTYDIEITFANGAVDTFIANSKLTLAPEVHHTASPAPPTLNGGTK